MADERERRPYDRRTFLAAVGATGAATALGSRAAVTSASAAAQPGDQTFVSVMEESPADLQFNPFNNRGWSDDVADVLFDRFARYNYATGEMEPELLSGWTHSESTFALSIHEGATWHDGDPVRSRDLQTYFELADVVSLPFADYYDDVTTRDDRTVVLELSETTNQTLLEHDILRRHAAVKHEEYAEYLTAGESALRDFAPTDGPGNGPFEFADRDSETVRFQRFADYPDADAVQFTDYEFVYRLGQQRVKDSLRDASVDGVPGTGSVTRSFVDDLPQEITAIRIPDKWGLGLAVDHDDDHVGQRAVRQAMLHVIDAEAIVDDQDYFKRPVSLPCGLDPLDVDRWIRDRDAFEAYDSESEAAALLRDAGFSRDGGTWVDSDGEPLGVPITVPSNWRDWVVATELVAAQLDEFGFDASVRTVDDYFGTLAAGDYTVVATSWLPGAPKGSVPYHALEGQFVPTYINDHAYYTTGSVTVPERGGSGTTTIEYEGLLDDLASTGNRDAAESIVTELAWLVNQDLPLVPIMTGETVSFIADDGWSVPPASDDVYGVQWPTSHLVRTGDLVPSGEDNRSTPSTEASQDTATDTSGGSSTASPTETSTVSEPSTTSEAPTAAPMTATETPVTTEPAGDGDEEPAEAEGSDTFIDEIVDILF